MPREFIENYEELLRPLTDELEARRVNLQYMVIDGQQRLVSIYLAKKGSAKVSGRERSIAIYYNPISNDPNDLKLAHGRELEKEPYWFRVSDILSAEVVSEVLDKKAETVGDESITKNRMLQKKLESFRRVVMNYPINIYEIPEDTLPYNREQDNFLEIFEKISEMFVRLNSTGTRIRMTELIVAILTAKTRRSIGDSFKSKLREIVSYFDGKGWKIDEPVLMRTYMAISTGMTRFREARDELEQLGRTDSQKIIRYLEDVKHALEKTVGVLSEELGVKEIKYLKSKYSMVTLAYYIFKRAVITPEDIHSIKRWLLLSSFNKRYTGRLESDLGEDIESISKGKGLKDLENQLTVREVTESMFEGTYDSEHLTALLMLLKDGYDLRTDTLTPVKIGSLKPKNIHVHHIFPKDLLTKVYGDKIGEMDIETAYDSVANITIISSEANEKIGSKRPNEYLRRLAEHSPQLLETHCIPLDQELWKADNYELFIAERRKQLFNEVQSMIQ